VDTRSAAARWTDTWVDAWRSHDVEAVVALYAEECVHRSTPFRAPHRGRAAVRAYVAGAFADESGVVDVRFGTPAVDGSRAWVEYWATVLDRHDAPVTLAGSAFARFDRDGLVTEARDYWHQIEGHARPPDAWGA
jgi:uncharacterized protein (TIGR02246 family)